jgi:hypothetical protein
MGGSITRGSIFLIPAILFGRSYENLFRIFLDTLILGNKQRNNIHTHTHIHEENAISQNHLTDSKRERKIGLWLELSSNKTEPGYSSHLP